MKFIITTIFALIIQFSIAQESAFKVGDKAPNFTGADQYGNSVHLDKLLSKGNVVVVFYRGAWCPHCQKHMSFLQDSLHLILDKGTNVVAVTPERPDSREKMVSKTGAEFSIIS